MFQEGGLHRHSEFEVEERPEQISAALGVDSQVHMRRGMGVEFCAKLRWHEFEGEAAQRVLKTLGWHTGSEIY